MTKNASYQQFIYGKVVGGGEYGIVALSKGLVGREAELLRLQARYGLTGPQPSRSTHAAGIFRDGSQLVLVQATRGEHNGEQVVDVQGREFVQYRYVFLPLSAIETRRQRLTDLILRITKRDIDIFAAPSQTLLPLPAESIAPRMLDISDMASQVAKTLDIVDDRGRALVLVALDALLSNRRVVVTPLPERDQISAALIDSVIMLLPISYRSRVGIAVGRFDERYCTWARLLLKYNGSPAESNDLVWIDNAQRRVASEPSEPALIARYARLITVVVSCSPSLAAVLSRLETIDTDGDDLSLLNLQHLPLEIIDLVGEDECQMVWEQVLSDIKPEELQALIPKIKTINALDRVWHISSTRFSVHDPDTIALLLSIWDAADDEQRRRWTDNHLQQRLELAIALLNGGLLQRGTRSDLFGLCLAAVAYQRQSNIEAARRLALDTIKYQVAHTASEQFRVLDQTIDPAQIERSLLIERFCMDFVELLWQAPAEFRDSQLCAAFEKRASAALPPLHGLIQGREEALDQLILFADALDLDLVPRSELYATVLATWTPTVQQANLLLGDLLLTRKRAPKSATQQLGERFLGASEVWFERHLPQVISLLPQSAWHPNWKHWQAIAQALYERPSNQVWFWDQVSDGELPKALIRLWLEVMADDPAITERFASSWSWKTLQTAVQPDMARIVPLLSDDMDLAGLDLVELVYYAQTTLDLSANAMFALIERLPQRITGSGSLSARQATDLLGIYLQHRRVINCDQSSLYNLVRQRQPALTELIIELQKKTSTIALEMIDGILLAEPTHVHIITGWVRLAGRGDLFRRTLLERLVDSWSQKRAVDLQEVSWIGSSQVTKFFTADDWLVAMCINWIPGGEDINLQGAPPPLNKEQKARFQKKAREFLRAATHPKQVQQILDSAGSFGFDATARLKLLSNANPSACTVSLVAQVFAISDPILDLTNDEQLLTFVARIRANDESEQTHMVSWLSPVIYHLLNADSSGWTRLSSLERITERNIFSQSFNEATRKIIARENLKLMGLISGLKQQGLEQQAQAILQGIKNHWQQIDMS